MLVLPLPVPAYVLNFGQNPDDFDTVFRFLIDLLGCQSRSSPS
jgi:hypothetical protein